MKSNDLEFSRAIVRLPCPNIINGITTANLGIPDYDESLRQHTGYVEALQHCGLDVTVIEADNNYPDSVFIEDTAIVTSNGAIIANPGAPSRRGEVEAVEDYLSRHFTDIERILPPGTVDGGDILSAGSCYYIGLSSRTNREGARQLSQILDKFGMCCITVPVEKALHLKSCAAYLQNNVLAVAGELRRSLYFRDHDLIEIPEDESYAANCLWVNGKVLLASGYPKTGQLIESLGLSTILLDVSEFRKLDGGLSCLSLRF